MSSFLRKHKVMLEVECQNKGVPSSVITEYIKEALSTSHQGLKLLKVRRLKKTEKIIIYEEL